jgi:phosphoglycolate phosphatase-like HAD superfamily hydrolase
MLVVFDLDGVIIDSERLIRTCYRRAYAPLTLPDSILASEGVDWLGDQVDDDRVARAIKERKDDFYLDMLSDGDFDLLPGYEVAVALASEGHATGILTGAPVGTCATIARCVDTWPFLFVCEKMRTTAKMDWIRRVAAPAGVYVDDQAKYIDLPDGWRLVRYTGQDVATLTREVNP